MIEIKDLTMDYGNFRALDGLTLTIPQGEFFAFLGPNGAGKTTAIKLLTGLMKPVKGTVHLGGFDMQEQPLLAKALLGYVPDVAVFYEKLTPLEFMRFIADIFEMDEVKAEKTGAELFQKFSLGAYAHQRIENLSHGTRQRLAIAAALLHEPKVFIIDEPMVGLDPIHARTVKRELKERSRAGMTVLMSTHLLNIAEELADRIGILHKGRLIALGTMDEIHQVRSTTGKRLEEVFLEMVSDETEQNGNAAAEI
ncbi:ABC transporter ATP-binding protein [Verrucomicrobium sp. BvORR034]|jgi:ABC-2 type transport system ATP-binding protein|uniref:ABC transporter ATP-binding protein n=1 Tax=Verrucomicrobium sp. BvORR034 TaxID=1396418 RepID=UPI00067995DD|nr:ABC transporter ATP-binding protein [Verrucomicrobium sp. BvORR034]